MILALEKLSRRNQNLRPAPAPGRDSEAHFQNRLFSWQLRRPLRIGKQLDVLGNTWRSWVGETMIITPGQLLDAAFPNHVILDLPSGKGIWITPRQRHIDNMDEFRQLTPGSDIASFRTVDRNGLGFVQFAKYRATVFFIVAPMRCSLLMC
jgi:hypothetical protein